MEYQTFKKNKGFSLMEVLIVIVILTIFLTITTSVYYNIKKSNEVDIVVSDIVGAIRYSKNNSTSGVNDSKWGIKILPGQIVIFKGESYSSRDINFDETIDISNGVSITGIDEIIFNRIDGGTSNIGNIGISNDLNTKNIFINEKGTVTY